MKQIFTLLAVTVVSNLSAQVLTLAGYNLTDGSLAPDIVAPKVTASNLTLAETAYRPINTYVSEAIPFANANNAPAPYYSTRTNIGRVYGTTAFDVTFANDFTGSVTGIQLSGVNGLYGSDGSSLINPHVSAFVYWDGPRTDFIDYVGVDMDIAALFGLNTPNNTWTESFANSVIKSNLPSTGLAGKTLHVELFAYGQTGVGGGTLPNWNFSGIQLLGTTSIPEPTSVLLIAASSLGVFMRRRR